MNKFSLGHNGKEVIFIQINGNEAAITDYIHIFKVDMFYHYF